MKRLSLALLVAGALAGCGSESETTPAACLQGADAYLAALESAPDQVLLGGEAPISDCLVRDQPPGSLNTVGGAVITAATQLNTDAARRPGGDAVLRLGYLVGAIEEGASRTGGIHTDLVRRLNAAARFSTDPDGPGAEFERTFGTGYAAAREAG